MKNIIVDIADMQISNNPDDEIVTYSLGSCIGATVYDAVACVGGMIHCMLPLAKTDREKAQTRPFMFVDTGFAIMLQGLFDLGLRKANAVVKIAGCSQILDHKGLFRIGERNYTVFRKILWKNGMMIESEDIGGTKSRTLRLEMATGRVTVKSSGEVVEL